MVATETYGPFDTLPWADQTQWYRFAPTWAPSGVIDAPAASASAGGLGLTFSGLTPTIAVGRAWARGAGYEISGGSKTLTAITPNTNATLSRQDRLVLRRDLSAKTVSIVPLTGTPSSTPTPPALTQVETGQWDTLLHTFLVPPASGSTITGIVDERVWVNPDGGGVGPRLVFSTSSVGASGALTAGSAHQARSVSVPAHSPGRLHMRCPAVWTAPANAAGTFYLETPSGTTLTASQIRSVNGGQAGAPVSVAPEAWFWSDGSARTLYLSANVEASSASITVNEAAFSVWLV